MRVLVTGGAGFIGANLVRSLVEHGCHVTIFDNLSTGRRDYVAGLPIEFVEGDVLDADLLKSIVPGHDGVVHLAAQTGVPGSLTDPLQDCRVNVIGTLNMLETCRHAGTARFVFASSNAPLGRQPPPATEDKAPLPISPYGASKLAGEGYCLAYHGSWGLGTVVLRFANVYGPCSAHKDNVVAKFFKDILSKGEVTIDGDGEQTRDFVFVGDLCRAILLALEGEASGEVFQIATGVETSILEIAAMVQEVAGKPAELRHGLARRGDIGRNYSSVGKAKEELGWQPVVRLRAGLQETAAWYQTRNL